MTSTIRSSGDLVTRILDHIFALAILAVLVPAPASAASGELTLPSRAHQLGERISLLDSYALPVGPVTDGHVPVQVFEGRVARQSWRVDGAITTTLQVLAPLRDQITAAGYDIVFDCRDTACGGFDFRFETEVIPAPDMQVDLRDYRFLSAVRGQSEALSLLVSRAGMTAFIQAIHVSPPDQERLRINPRSRQVPQAAPNLPEGLAETLQADGHVVLSDLAFKTGAAQLNNGPFSSLEQLVGLLKDNPSYRIALVGHTDSIGSLADNISLSKRRAIAVRARMVDQYAIAPARIEAEGMGYLAPVASNLTRAGRKANRRVEAILLSQ